MMPFLIRTLSKTRQCIAGILLVAAVAGICSFFSAYAGYKVIGFILLLTVSLIAMFFDIVPVLVIAAISAITWDFFFIPPHFTLSVASTEDAILLGMYFIIALVSGVLTYKIRKAEKELQQKEEKANTVRLYNTLFNSLSHELRTPIAAIIGATDNLVNNNQNLNPYNRHELASEISKAAFRLNQQVENLLNMSRLESGFIRPRQDWTDIEELIYESVSRVEENHPDRQVSINVNPSIPLFKIDKGMLEQSIYNLLNNAAQYTPEGSVINITAAAHADVLQVIIEDEGPGFPADEVALVFDKFYRLKHTKTGGTGLGLSIVKGFTQAQGGNVQLESKPTGGARFTIEIPAEVSYIKNLKNE